MSVALAPLKTFEAIETEADFQKAFGATEAQMADLRVFHDFLAEKNEVMNLIGPATLPQFWNRHVWDSAQLMIHAPHALTFADLGAGAGFPGLVLAILLKDRPGAMVHLVESMAKRCRFLTEVVTKLKLPAKVHNIRAEDLSLPVDIVTARACAPAVRLLGYARPYLAKDALGLFLKGQDVETELSEAAKVWKFQSELRPSLSSDSGHIWIVKGAPRER